jgi:hypothetical protein
MEFANDVRKQGLGLILCCAKQEHRTLVISDPRATNNLHDTALS